ncbi:MAG: DUF2125 domain-containing protein [Rhodospirillaceae bacterium]
MALRGSRPGTERPRAQKGAGKRKLSDHPSGGGGGSADSSSFIEEEDVPLFDSKDDAAPAKGRRRARGSASGQDGDGAQKRRRRRRRSDRSFFNAKTLLLVIGGPLLLAMILGAYVGFWYYTSAIVSNGISHWATTKRAEGYDVSYSDLNVGGFPLGVVVTFVNPQMRAPEKEGGWSWSAPLLRTKVNPFNSRSFTITADGVHRLTIPGSPGGPLVSMTLVSEDMGGPVDLNSDGTFAEMEFSASDLSVTGHPIGPFQFEEVSLSLKRGAEAASEAGEHGITPRNGLPIHYMADLEIENLTLSPRARLTLSDTVRAAEATVWIHGTPPIGPMWESLAGWRDDGGRIQVSQFIVDWPPLAIQSSGSFLLDDDLQPEGTLTARTRGLFDLIRGLSASGAVASADARTASMMLAGQSGTSGLANVALAVRDRVLYAGPAPLMEVPTLYWGSGGVGFTPRSGQGPGPRSPDRLKPGFEIDRDGNIVRDGVLQDPDEAPRMITLPPIPDQLQ